MNVVPTGKSPRTSLICVVVPMLAIMPGHPTLAQDEASGDISIEEIVVTGSRIRRTEFSSQSPIQIINMDMATLAGQVDVAEILQESTVAANAPQVNNSGLFPFRLGGPGVNTIDLRGLGVARTLVLLNGRRLNPAGTRGTVAAVDLNTIPSSIIERIEVLKDGASSVYGSDAVAGVVNIITRKGADGLGGSVSYSAPFDGGGEIMSADLSIGISANDSSFLFGVDYFERETLLQGDRDWARCRTDMYRDPVTGEDLDTIDPATGKAKCFDSAAYDYVINYGDYYADGGASRSIYDPSISSWRIASQDERKFDHPAADNGHIVSPARRISVFSFGNWGQDGLGDGTEGYYEILYTSRRSDQNTGPRQFGIWFDDSPWSPFYNAGGWARDLPLLMPYEQTYEQEVDWLRGILGLTGELSRDWSWDVNVGYGRSDGTYGSPQMLFDRILNSQDLVEVGDGEYDCAVNQDPSAPGSGECVPLNPFAIIQDNVNSPDLFPRDYLDYVMSIETGETVYTQTSVAAYLTGTLFDMPAGSVAAVIGVEGRRETIDDTPSSGSINGNLYEFNSSGITTGTDTVKEVYAEMELPLIKDATAVKELRLNVAGRFSSYDTAGSETTYRVGLNWQIVDQLRLRSSFGTSFRAPSLYESFLGGERSWSTLWNDPCIYFGTDHEPQEPIYQNCLAEIGDVDYSIPIAGSRVVTYGNAGRIEAETAESLTIGLIVELEVIDLAIAVDYFEFTIEDEIARYGPDSILSQCYNLPTSKFRQPGTICDFITPRRPVDHYIEEINDSYFNIDKKYQEGLDLTMSYQFAVGVLDFVADLRATKILDFTQDLFGGQVDDLNGRLGYADINGQFDLRAMFRDWTFYYGLDYVGSQSDYDWYDFDPAETIFIMDADSVTYHDLALRYHGNGWSAQLGVQNVADRQPPMVSRFFADWAGNAANNTGYDPRGRTFFINMTKGF